MQTSCDSASRPNCHKNNVYCTNRRRNNVININRRTDRVDRADHLSSSSCQSLIRQRGPRRRRDRCRLDVISQRYNESSSYQSGVHGTAATCQPSQVTDRHSRLRGSDDKQLQLMCTTSSTMTTCQSFNAHSVQHHSVSSTVSIHCSRLVHAVHLVLLFSHCSLNRRHATT